MIRSSAKRSILILAVSHESLIAVFASRAGFLASFSACRVLRSALSSMMIWHEAYGGIVTVATEASIKAPKILE